MNKYYISSIHDSYEDNYENGEGAFCNSWKQERTVKATNLDEALKFYFQNELYINYNLKNLDINDVTIQTSVLVDVENCEASEYEIEKWKVNELTLYVQHITIKAEILQEVNIEEELLTVNL